MPVRAPAPWLHETLAGLALQTLEDWRLVLVVHGDDDTVTSEIGECAFPVLVTHAPEELNLSEVLNWGLAHCDAPYVARLDCDDVPMPERLAATCRALDERPDCAVVASMVDVIDGSGAATGQARTPTQPDALVRAMRWRNVIVHSATTFRRDVIVELGGYQPSAVGAEDYDLWLRVLTRSGIAIVPAVLLEYRVHPNQVTKRRRMSTSTVHAVAASRSALARARGESVAAARVRQFAWAVRQRGRRFGS